MHGLIYDKNGRAADYIILDVNPAYESILQIKKEEAVGVRATELYKTVPPPFIDIYADVAETGKPSSFEVYFAPLEKHFSISVSSPARGKFNTIFTDITESIRMNEELRHERDLLARITEKVFAPKPPTVGAPSEIEETTAASEFVGELRRRTDEVRKVRYGLQGLFIKDIKARTAAAWQAARDLDNMVGIRYVDGCNVKRPLHFKEQHSSRLN